jgi:hypothetical protein
VVVGGRVATFWKGAGACSLSLDDKAGRTS